MLSFFCTLENYDCLFTATVSHVYINLPEGYKILILRLLGRQPGGARQFSTFYRNFIGANTVIRPIVNLSMG
ncbi:hypothetical protein GCM10007275_02730 [Jeotgalicoccus coquinae]|nr:hypothetical protein GCM10007275_02730 [Jeotgalicoccus coquinae]